MIFLIVYIAAFFLSLIFGTIMEWIENKKGNRVITAKKALIVTGMALTPALNIVVAAVAVSFSLAVLLEKFGFFTWAKNTLDGLQEIILFTDRK